MNSRINRLSKAVLESWEPWKDRIWRGEGYKTDLEVEGKSIGYATMNNPKKQGGDWICLVYFGGGAPVVAGRGRVPAQAAADARQKLERSLGALR